NTNTAGLHTLYLQTYKGCDSTVNLTLTVNQPATTNLSAEICQGQTYTLNGFNADTAGTYTLNLQTYRGCDSTVNLSLLVNPTYKIDIQGEVCQGKFYYQNGFFEHMPGIHTRYLQTTEGCDSIINLHLTVNPIFSDTIYAQICQGEVYSENGFNFSVDTSGLYSLNLQSINGCDSIICLNLIVNEIVTPTNLTLNNIANYIELSWEGVGENYVIYRNNDSLSMTSIRIYQDSNVVEGVNYCYKIKAIDENCESVFSNQECQTFLSLNTISTNSFNAYLYPNPTDNKTTLRVEGLIENALVKIYDLTGRLIRNLELNANDKELEIEVQNLSKGVYNIRICNSTINITKKLIVN
ncbi:MAG: T9SS type A sorting domain-containing protein, partial [Bacteroidales bacterium]